MSTCQSLWLRDAAFWDSMESGDISMNCLSQKCLSHYWKKKQDRSTEFSGWEEWYSSVFMVSLAAVKEEDKRSGKRVGKSWALSVSHGGSSQEHINIWISVIWLSHPWMKYVMNHMRSANEAERQKWDEYEKFSLERRKLYYHLLKRCRNILKSL